MMKRLTGRPALIIVTLVLVFGIVGSIVTRDIGFMASPLDVPDVVAGLGMKINGVLAGLCMILVYRNLHRFEDQWTWQERGFSRGVFLVIFAGVLGYLARAFTEPTVTMGTPVYTVGILWIIWASVRSPERFEDSDGRPS